MTLYYTPPKVPIEPPVAEEHEEQIPTLDSKKACKEKPLACLVANMQVSYTLNSNVTASGTAQSTITQRAIPTVSVIMNVMPTLDIAESLENTRETVIEWVVEES